MAKHYGPKNVVISVAGNITDELLATIDQLFGHYEASKQAIEAELTYPEFTPGEIVKTRDTEQAHVAISFPAINVKDPGRCIALSR